ncbi:MAG TPA: DUF1538 domain-containing protein [Bacillota bacterium]|jgi:hypothetical protein|nr:DUF1538 domain-containing protein [Bacillota bacterium]HPZ78526.1 DUF1538 domain-containing protein [Bacillota bacterium]HQD74672.1 DUF1538 domain-containing protein [Bacillota bacterium]
MRIFVELVQSLWEAARNVLPLMLMLIVCQVLILKRSIPNVRSFGVGLAFVILGLFFFLEGISLSLIPMGEEVGRNLVLLDNKVFIIIIAFVIGYASTLVEPGLQALAAEVEEVSIGAIRQKILIHTVAIGVGSGMALGLLKILNNIPSRNMIIPILIITTVLILFAPEEFVGIAFDAASATTGPVNIPINMAIAIGLAYSVGGADPLLHGFGLVGLTSLGTMVTVLVLGILSRI